MSESAGYGDKPTREPESDHAIVVTPHAVVITLSEQHRQEAQKCLERSNKITFKIREISATSLPQTLLHDGVLID